MSGRRASGGSGSNSSSSFLGRPVLCPEMPSLSLRSASSLADSAAFLRDPPHYISSSPLQQPAGLRTVDIRPVLLSLWGSQLIRADALLCRRRCDGTCGSTQLGGDACCSNGWVCAHTVMVAACSAADGPCQPQTCAESVARSPPAQTPLPGSDHPPLNTYHTGNLTHGRAFKMLHGPQEIPRQPALAQSRAPAQAMHR